MSQLYVVWLIYQTPLNADNRGDQTMISETISARNYVLLRSNCTNPEECFHANCKVELYLLFDELSFISTSNCVANKSSQHCLSSAVKNVIISNESSTDELALGHVVVL